MFIAPIGNYARHKNEPAPRSIRAGARPRCGESAALLIDRPELSPSLGFVADSAGVHSSRTLMLAELRLILAACPSTTGVEGYRAAVVEENALLKHTATTRRATFKWLRQLYALDPVLPLFGALRRLWDADPAGQPLLALLCAMARDPLLHVSAPVILDSKVGEQVTWQRLAGTIDAAHPGRLNGTTLAATGRNMASTWQQSGHLSGKLRKVRVRVQPTPASTAYALLLGHLSGERGIGLFATPWARLLDATPLALDQQAFAAAQRGWLDYRRIGEIADFGFSNLLTPLGDVDGER